MPVVKTTIEMCQRIAAAWNPEIPFAEVGRQFGVDTDTVRRALKRVGVYQPRGNRPYSDEEKTAIAKLVDDGKTAKQIAEETGRPLYGIQTYLRTNFGKRVVGRPKANTSQGRLQPETGLGNSNKYLSMRF